MPNLGPYDQYLFAAVALLGTFGAMLALLWLTQRSRYSPSIRRFHGVAQNFMSVISVLFALNVAFLAHDTWTAHDRALDTVFLEAGGLRNILSLAGGLPADTRAEVRAAIAGYARLATDDEWPKLARRTRSDVAARQLDGLIALLASPVAAAAGPTVQGLLLQQAVSLRGTRDLRVALSQTHVNPLKWLGMAFLGLLTMASIAMVHIDNPRAEVLSVMLFAAAAAPTAAIILVHGNPFQEPASVGNAPIAAIFDLATTGGR